MEVEEEEEGGLSDLQEEAVRGKEREAEEEVEENLGDSEAKENGGREFLSHNDLFWVQQTHLMKN